MKTLNTYKHGSVTVFIYLEKKKYIGVCLELDIVDEDVDRVELANRMREQAQSYVKYVCNKQLDERLLNRPAPDKYWKMFTEYLHSLQELEKRPSLRVFPQAKEATIETLSLTTAAV